MCRMRRKCRKREQTADTSVSAVIGVLAAGFLQP
jgi:hypothetical protein